VKNRRPTVKRPKPDYASFKKTLFCKEADRVPLGDTSIDLSIKERLIGRKISTPQDEVEFWEKAGFDFVPVNVDLSDMNPDKKIPKEGIRKDKEGTLREGGQWASESQGIITTMAEFEKHNFPKVQDVDYSKFDEVGRILPDGMGILGTTGHIFTDVWRLMGFEAFAFALIENEELIASLFEKVGSIVYETTRNILDIESVGAIKFADDLAYTEGLIVSPEVYRRYFFPWLKKIVQLCSEKDIAFLYHSDGDLWEVINDLLDCGINALNPIEPKAMDIVEVKKKIGDRVCIVGNIDLGYTLTRGTPEEVAEEVRARIKEIGPGGGYSVSSSNSVPNYVPFENFEAMVKATFEFGKYPLEV
jgi:uroporphyrinogen decarboxylase